MAHFAEIDNNNIVLRVLVVRNEDCLDENGQESEEIGIKYLQNIVGGGTWIKTSYNNSIRKNYAGIGFTYDPIKDAFIPPKPIDEKNPNRFVFDEETCNWIDTQPTFF